jgi:hypothetical protein
MCSIWNTSFDTHKYRRADSLGRKDPDNATLLVIPAQAGIQGRCLGVDGHVGAKNHVHG